MKPGWTTAVAPGAFWPGAETAIARAATPEGVAALPQHRKHLRAGHCDFSYEAVTEDTDRNYWMSAEEAKAYGLVSRIIERIDLA